MGTGGTGPAIDRATIEQCIAMLERYVGGEELAPLLAVLRELPERPDDATLLARLGKAVDDLGVLQGAVLTYAPAIGGLLSDHPFGASR
jgi:hypothetical protein